MNRKHLLYSIFFGILYAGVFGVLSVKYPIYRILIAAVIGYGALLALYLLFYVRKFENWNIAWLKTFRLLLYIASFFGVLLIIPGFQLAIVWILFSSIFITASIYTIFQPGKQWYLIQLLLLIFAGSAIFAATLYYAPAFIWLHIILFTCFAWLVSLTTLIETPAQTRTILLISTIVAFISLQLYTVLYFLPVHFTVIAVTAGLLLYTMIVLAYYHLYQQLSRQKIMYQVLLTIVLIGVLFFNTAWKIVEN